MKVCKGDTDDFGFAQVVVPSVPELMHPASTLDQVEPLANSVEGFIQRTKLNTVRCNIIIVL